MEKRFVSPFPIGTGEAHFSSDEVDFTIARNAKFFFFAKMKKVTVGGKSFVEANMFEKAHPFSFKSYLGLPPRKAASDVEAVLPRHDREEVQRHLLLLPSGRGLF